VAVRLTWLPDPVIQPLRTLLDCAVHGEPPLPPNLREFYGGNLHFPNVSSNRPYVISNFVSTIDGVVSYRIPDQSGGAAISGSDRADRFIMGLLRSSVDAVIVGSRTVHEVSPKHLWIPEFIYPEAKEMYMDWRVNGLRKPVHPLNVIVTGSGNLDLSRAVFRTPEMRTLVITTATGKSELARSGVTSLGSVEVSMLEGVDRSIDPDAILSLLFSKFGARTVLHEGGPTLFGQFVALALVDELFLTLAPQIAGRLPKSNRPGLVQSMEFLPSTAPWFQLLSVKQKADHLYLRYRAAGKRKPSVT
jgi:riboflavin biosynthesis pyrimidine reductase